MVDDDRTWRLCQEALAGEAARVVELLRSLPPDPARPGSAEPGVVGRWNLAEVAVHLSQTWVVLPGLARGDLTELDATVPDRAAGASVARSVEHLGTVTVAAVAADPERDLSVLADRIETRARSFLADCVGQRPDQHRPWLLAGVTVPRPVFTAHLLSETVVHGWDIARAAGRPWRIDPGHAALVVRQFLFAVLLAGGPAIFGDRDRLAAARGRYLVAMRGQDSVRLVLDELGARVDTDPGLPDCRLSVDPVAFLLMFFGRRGPLGTVARGDLLAWGRKPWLALRLRAALPRP